MGSLEAIAPRLRATAEALLAALAAKPPGRIEDASAKPAAVLVPLMDDGDQVRMVFTRRTDHLPQHAGQISFPGGGVEQGDRDLVSTALRETREEIGVSPRQVEIITRLDQIVTVTNYLVTPFVGLLASPVEFSLNQVEVKHLLLVPLAKVLDRSQYVPTRIPWGGLNLNQLALHHKGEVIWGATARMLLNLLDTLGPAARTVAEAQKGVDSP